MKYEAGARAWNNFFVVSKRCVLFAEMIASMNRPIAPSANRERRVRYQHPKGAPDADLIFGSK